MTDVCLARTLEREHFIQVGKAVDCIRQMLEVSSIIIYSQSSRLSSSLITGTATYARAPHST